MGEFDPTDYGGGDDADADFLGIDGGDGEEGKDQELTLKDALLFVVDCSFKGVLEPLRPGGRPAVAEVLASAASVLKTKVITSPDDRVGVVLYGIREKNNPNSFEGIRVIQELDRPNAHRIRQLQQEVDRSAEQFEERYGMLRPVPLSDVFWTCTTIFNLSANPKRYQPRVFLFTGNEMPCNTLAEQDAAETRAKDLLDLGVEVEFFPMIPASSSFSIERFWGRVLPVESDDYVSQAAVRVEELERRVRRRVHRKRVLQRLSFELCPGTEIAVGIHVNIIQAKVPNHVYLLNENNKLLKSDMKNLCEQTGSILHPVDDIETYVDVAGKRVYVTRAEVNEAKYFGDSGVKLLGFKPASKLQSHHRIFHSYFIYPLEKEVKGSAALTATLIDTMLERKLMAIVRYIPRKSSIPFLAALLPQAESEDANGGDQARPPGFNMVLLPFADEIRKLIFSAPEGLPVAQELIDGALNVVNAMRIDGFTPGCVENPVLQKHYAAVQALALGEEQPEETVDVLQPDAAALSEKAPVVSAWRSSIEASLVAAGPVVPRVEHPPAKRQRVAPSQRLESQDITLDSMRTMVSTGEVERLTVSQLREFLRSQGIANSGKKPDLVERTQALF